VNRRREKSKQHTLVDFQLKLGNLTTEQADRFKWMFSQCRKASEFEQVSIAFRSFCNGIQTATDRHALLMQDDPLGLDDA
jgi:hypothetical protein